MSNCGIVILGVLLFAGSAMQGQQTTNTNCSVLGSNVNCTSTTTDNAAQQQQAYEAGQKVGDAVGNGIALAMLSHAKNSGIKKYCAGHPGESWRWMRSSDEVLLDSGRCPTDEEKGVIAANEFMGRHKDFIREQANSKVLVAYLGDHKLDPRDEKSYERAYKDLKKAGQLDLYKK